MLNVAHCSYAHDLSKIYTEQLAKHLGRDDLHIVSVKWFEEYKYKGRQYSEIIVDHAVVVSNRLYSMLYNVRAELRDEYDV